MHIFPVGMSIPVLINTEKADGTPITFSGSPALGVRKGVASAVTTGLGTLTVDAGGITGDHTIEIDTSAGEGYYEAGNVYYLVATAGTIDGISAVGKAFFVFMLGPIGADVQAWDGGAVPTPAEAGAAMTLTEAYDAAKVAAPSAASVADAVWDEAIADHVGAGTFGAKNQKVVPSETIGDYKADVSALALEATVQALNDISAAEVNAEVDQALLDYGAAKPADLASLSTAAALAVVDGIVDQIKVILDKLDTAMELDGAVYRFTENALEEAPSGGDIPTVDEINTKLETEHGAGSWGAQGSYTITPTTPVTNTETGAVIVGATVKIYSNSSRTDVITEEKTDTNGSFTAHVTAPGTYYLRATKEGYQDIEWSEVAS